MIRTDKRLEPGGKNIADTLDPLRVSGPILHDAVRSFLDEEQDTASYAVEYVSSLEKRVKELEGQLVQHHCHGEHSSAPSLPRRYILASPDCSMRSNPVGAPAPNPEVLENNLKSVSMAAVAEPFLGPTAGLSFARLTQAVLRRPALDGSDFVFNAQLEDITFLNDGPTTTHLDFMNMMSIDPQSFNLPLLNDDNAANPFCEQSSPLDDVPDEAEIQQLVMFYFEHFHPLYPIINQREFMADLKQLLIDTKHELQLPSTLFRTWMVFAIGLTAYPSITLSEEGRSRRYYDKAMTYFDQSMDHGDIVALEVVRSRRR
ncbi:unnamed protein product [Zymoseptoria tritici ST99CH_3D7]|uniref:Transcription factor domain-containing protein n=1 Tax=Zymoseptoria tritici (strain ST99CH_3D7) TaxID=1276538 RepID=A0A1X7S3W4_ZYMT9|nr:unnamed protein product [Zymoseptoria tritici ST99CH_3D7]